MSGAVSSTAGRPRDPGVDQRIADAAVDVFGEVGWARFSVEAVARRAGVGKGSVYLRWPTKEDLLLAALRNRLHGVINVAPGTVRGELFQLARQVLLSYLGDSGTAMLRIALEVDRIPGVGEHYESIRRAQVLAARGIVTRAIERGELPGGTSVTLLLDVICGAAMMHALAMPSHLREESSAQVDAYVTRLVDFTMNAVLAADPPKG